jgi:hypothetical protein
VRGVWEEDFIIYYLFIVSAVYTRSSRYYNKNVENKQIDSVFYLLVKACKRFRSMCIEKVFFLSLDY